MHYLRKFKTLSISIMFVCLFAPYLLFGWLKSIEPTGWSSSWCQQIWWSGPLLPITYTILLRDHYILRQHWLKVKQRFRRTRQGFINFLAPSSLSYSNSRLFAFGKPSLHIKYPYFDVCRLCFPKLYKASLCKHDYDIAFEKLQENRVKLPWSETNKANLPVCHFLQLWLNLSGDPRQV